MKSTIFGVDRSIKTAGIPRHVCDITKWTRLEKISDIAPWDPRSKDPKFKDEFESEYDGEYIDHFPHPPDKLSKITQRKINPLIEEYDPLKDELEKIPPAKVIKPEEKDKLSTIYRDDYIDYSKKYPGKPFTKGKTRYGTQVNRIRPISFGNGRDTAGVPMSYLNQFEVRKTIPKSIPVAPKMIKKKLYIKDEGDQLFESGADNDFRPTALSTIYRDNYVNYYKDEKMRPLEEE
jgi:hypothetical protein